MKIAIIGLGLIGGSIGRAALKKTEHEVYGRDLSDEVVQKAKLLEAISDELDDEKLATCDLIVLAVCPSAAISVMNEVLPKLKRGAILIDVCGTKRKIVSKMGEAREAYPEINFVGVHPMAGREFSGISHAVSWLFENSYVILTPVHSDIFALSAVKNFFSELGACNVTVATAEKHDEMISYTSQLAHVVSSCYIKNQLSKNYAGFSAGSFRDMTRVAKLNPKMWTELCMENRDNLAVQIDDLRDRLSEFSDALKTKDESRLYKLFSEGAARKEEAENLMKEKRKNDRN